MSGRYLNVSLSKLRSTSHGHCAACRPTTTFHQLPSIDQSRWLYGNHAWCRSNVVAARFNVQNATLRDHCGQCDNDRKRYTCTGTAKYTKKAVRSQGEPRDEFYNKSIMERLCSLNEAILLTRTNLAPKAAKTPWITFRGNSRSRILG